MRTAQRVPEGESEIPRSTGLKTIRGDGLLSTSVVGETTPGGSWARVSAWSRFPVCQSRSRTLGLYIVPEYVLTGKKSVGRVDRKSELRCHPRNRESPSIDVS